MQTKSKMKRLRLLVGITTLNCMITGVVPIARADDAAGSLSPLDRRLNALEEEVRSLKKEIALEKKANAGKTNEVPVVAASKDGFALKSGDGNFQLRLGGYVQTDGRFYFGDKAHAFSDTFLIRRARPVFEATVYKDFTLRLMPDFGNGSTVLYDAYVDWKHWSWLGLRVGKFKPPIGLERLQNDPDQLFAETALPTALVPTRDIGAQLGGDLFGGAVNYAVGIFNGAVDGSSTTDIDTGDSKDAAARIFLQPLKNTNIEPLQKLGVGMAGSYGNQQIATTSTNLPTFKTPGQQTFFSYRSTAFPNGERTRLAPQGYYYWGPFGLLGEYTISGQQVTLGTTSETLRDRAWQVAASFLLTGDDASFTGVNPKHPFDPKTGQWGAWEIAGRYHVLEVDRDTFPTFANPATAASKATAWGVGLNWYLSRNMRADLDYEQTAFNGGATVGTRRTEEIVFTRLQLRY